MFDVAGAARVAEMDSVGEPTWQFRQPATRRATAAAFLLGLVGVFAWLIATHAHKSGYRGFDFRTMRGQLIGVAIATAPLAVGLDYAWRLLRGLPDLVVSSTGVRVRRLFRSRFVEWGGVQRIVFDRDHFKLFGRKTPTITLLFADGKRALLHADFEGCEPTDALAVLQDAWSSSGRRAG